MGYSRALYKHDYGQEITTDVEGVGLSRAFLAHLNIENAAAADEDGVLLANLGATVQAITAGITSPAVPRTLSVDGNVAGVVGNVKITGTNYANEVIDETIALNQTTLVNGVKAFKTIAKIDLPVQAHTPAAQTETIAITAAVTPEADGDITMAITSTALGEASPKAVVVAVTGAMDDVTKVATAIVDALNADEDVAAHFLASNEAGVITLTALAPLANDATLAFGYTDTDDTGVTAGASTNGTAGVPYDIVSIGWGDKFGLPYILPYSTLVKAYLDGTADTGTITADADELEKNVFVINGTPDGAKDIDLYLIV